MSADGRLFCPASSPLAPLVDGLAWLWRLGPRRETPSANAIGFGAAADASELAAMIAARRLAGAIVLAEDSAAEAAPLPSRRLRHGVARFGGVRVEGTHSLFADGEAVVRSSLGVHAVRAGNLLMVGLGPSMWGRLDGFWALEAIARFLVERLQRPLVLLPPAGCLRLDDFPGTAELQLLQAAKTDRRQRRRAQTTIARLERARAQLVVAVVASALEDDAEVPLDRVWPRAVAALARGAQRGVLEPSCHGLLHLESEALAEGRVAPREFATLNATEARRRLDAAAAWMQEHVGEPRSFIAPAWGYGPGALEAASARGLPTWLPPDPGPVLRGTAIHETLQIGLPGLHKLDYAPLRRLAALGLPPTVVFHGQLLDDRLPRLRAARDVISAVRLARLPDLPRIARLSGIRWVGAAELMERLRAHAAIEVVRAEVRPGPDGPPRLFDGRRVVEPGDVGRAVAAASTRG